MVMPRRPLSLFDLLCLGVNAIVGSGIYAFPGLLASLLGPASFLAFALCGVVGLVVAFCFAEAASMFDRSGGPYVYARAAFGGPAGYLVGWTCWAAALVSWAAVTRALVPYLGHVWSPLGSGTGAMIAALAITLLLGAINYFGIKPGAYATDLLTVAKLVPLFVLTAAGLRSFDRARLRPFAPHGFAALPRATFIAFFAFQGFEVVPVPAAESTNPRRNVPLAIVASLIGTTLFYVVIQIAAVASTTGLAGSEQPLAVMGEQLLGPIGGQLVAGAAVVSMLGFCAGVALASPRYLEALSADGHLPPVIGRRHRRFDTPYWAILVTTLLSCSLTVALDFARLVDLSVLTVAVQYLATCAAVPVLRYRLPGAPRGFRLPLGPTVPALAVAIVLALIGTRLLSAEQAPGALLAGFGVMLAIGLIPALLWRLLGR